VISTSLAIKALLYRVSHFKLDLKKTVFDGNEITLNDKTEREHARNSFGLLPQGYFEQNMTSSVLSVLFLIYGYIPIYIVEL